MWLGHCSPLGLGPWRLRKDTNPDMKSVLADEPGWVYSLCTVVNLVSDP